MPLSIEYSIITPFTRFIAVEERQEVRRCQVQILDCPWINCLIFSSLLHLTYETGAMDDKDLTVSPIGVIPDCLHAPVDLGKLLKSRIPLIQN